jgi:hypothetical protein
MRRVDRRFSLLFASLLFLRTAMYGAPLESIVLMRFQRVSFRTSCISCFEASKYSSQGVTYFLFRTRILD